MAVAAGSVVAAIEWQAVLAHGSCPRLVLVLVCRWTMSLKAWELPWQPTLLFSGRSFYKVGDQGWRFTVSSVLLDLDMRGCCVRCSGPTGGMIVRDMT
jgi:hypothetical protein